MKSVCKECKKAFKQPKRRQGGGALKIFCTEKCRTKTKSKKPQSITYQKKWIFKKTEKMRKEGTLRNHRLFKKYGITEIEWNDLFAAQGSACAICRSTAPSSIVGWHTDHDHNTGEVRGILCENCNRGLGMYQDDVSFLRRAAAYLGVHQGILGPTAIKRANIIQPFKERTVRNGLSFGVSMAGYDIRLDQGIIMGPKAFRLASSVEYFDMPNDIVGMVCDKSSHARRGLQAFNTIIEPGWRGYLTLELFNASDNFIKLNRGDPIVQVVFHSLDEPTEQPYSGKYQDQPRGPVAAKLER